METSKERKVFTPDSVLDLPFGRCSFETCSTTFTSTIGAERHLKHSKWILKILHIEI